MIALNRLVLLKNVFHYFILIVVLLATMNDSRSQDTAVFRDKRGEKINYRITNKTVDGYIDIRVKTKARVEDYDLRKDSLNDKLYAEFGKHVIDDYSQVLGLTSHDIRFTYIANIDSSHNQIVFRQTYGSVPIYRTEIRISIHHLYFAHGIEATICRGIGCDSLPKINSGQALQVVKASAHQDGIKLGTPELTVLPLLRENKRNVYLVWMIHTDTRNQFAYFVNAIDGTIVWESHILGVQ